MKIIKLQARNVKNLKAIEITPEGNAVILSGKNGVGKSAIIDAIFSTLTGRRLKDVVRHGEERADVTVELNDFTVKKVWTPKGETIQVYSLNEEGKKIKYSSPQTFLDEKIGALSFDPMEFKNMKSMDRVELLKKITGLEFTDIEKDKAVVYEDRTVLNSKIKEAVAHLTNTEAPDPATPNEEIAFKDALKELQDLRDKRQAYTGALDLKKQYEDTAKIHEQAADEIADKIAELQEALEDKRKAAASHKQHAEAVVIPENVSQEQIIAAESALQDIEHKNSDIRAAKRYRQAVKDADKLRKESDTLTERIRRLDQDKTTRVANAKFPIPGLSLTDEAVMYEGTQFDRLSTGQQIRVSTAIGMALNPELKVIFIREASMLDTGNLKEIVAQAKDKDYQVWLERCDETGQVGFFIEAGEITAAEIDQAVYMIDQSQSGFKAEFDKMTDKTVADLSAFENKLKSASISARVDYILQELEDMETADQRAFLSDYEQKGIITQSIIEELVPQLPDNLKP